MAPNTTAITVHALLPCLPPIVDWEISTGNTSLTRVGESKLHFTATMFVLTSKDPFTFIGTSL